MLNEWIVAWVDHQAAVDPAHLANANIFFPERDTLAYSEYLLVPAALGAPVRWLGGSAVLEYNLLVILGLALTGFAGFLLIARWTRDVAAGIVGGVILAFNAHTLTRLPQLQALHVEFIPLSLIALDCLLEHAGAVVALAVCVVLQGLTSYYALVLTVTALAAGWLVRVEDWRSDRVRLNIRRVLIAAALALAILIPAFLPYIRLGHFRTLDEAARYSASLKDYLATPARIHYGTWSAKFFGDPTALFPGVTAIVLSLIAIATGTVIRNPRARMALAIGIAGVILSFGPSVPGEALLYRLIVPLEGIRNMARFGYLATVAMAILAGFGIAWMRSRWPSARWMPIAIGALFLFANLDAFSAPIEYVDAEAISPIHALLLGSTAVVAEFPFYPPDRIFHHAPYLLHSTRHWRPMLNGYSGLTPESFDRNARDLAHFPDAHAIDTLRRLGVTHVFVHDRLLRDWTDNETADAVPHASGLRKIAADGDVALYEVTKE